MKRTNLLVAIIGAAAGGFLPVEAFADATEDFVIQSANDSLRRLEKQLVPVTAEGCPLKYVWGEPELLELDKVCRETAELLKSRGKRKDRERDEERFEQQCVKGWADLYRRGLGTAYRFAAFEAVAKIHLPDDDPAWPVKFECALATSHNAEIERMKASASELIPTINRMHENDGAHEAAFQSSERKSEAAIQAVHSPPPEDSPTPLRVLGLALYCP